MLGISIHAPRTGSDEQQRPQGGISPISIHAPRTGSDDTADSSVADSVNFNPRSPHGERPDAGAQAGEAGDFNPRSPHGERLLARQQLRHAVKISIHAPRTGSDHRASDSKRLDGLFQSTLPARGATRAVLLIYDVYRISIHAPRTGSDRAGIADNVAPHLISIHAPRTGSDADQARPLGSFAISIHAPRTGSDTLVQSLASLLSEFQSTLPARGATAGAPAD